MTHIPIHPRTLSHQPLHPPLKASSGLSYFPPPSCLENVDLKTDTVLEALIGETHHAVSRTAVLASWTNALARPEMALNAPTLSTLIPEDPAIMITMRRWIRSSTPLSVETLHQTQAFFWNLGKARESFRSFLNEANQIGLIKAGILHRTLLADSWQIGVKHALKALNAQASQTELNLPDIYQENANALLNLLSKIKTGGSPCLNPNGTIRLPDLPNQRRSARRYLLENCFVKTQKQTFTAFARDVSMGGMGIDRVPYLPIGKPVMIKLPTGRIFSGYVRWYKTTSAGIEFDTPLAPTDPLLSI